MAKTRRVSRSEKKLHAYCHKNAKKGLKTKKVLLKLLKKKTMKKKEETEYLTKFMKECKDLYMEKKGKLVPNCKEHTRRVFELIHKILPKSKKSLTKKERARITKDSMKVCKKEYPVF